MHRRVGSASSRSAQGLFYGLMAASAIPGLLVGLAWGVAPAVAVVSAATGLLSLDARPAPAARDADGIAGGVTLARCPRRARGERESLVPLALDRRALESTPLVRSGARRRLGRPAVRCRWASSPTRTHGVRTAAAGVSFGSRTHGSGRRHGEGASPRVLTVGLVLVVVLGMWLYLDGVSRLEDGAFGIGSFVAACVGHRARCGRRRDGRSGLAQRERGDRARSSGCARSARMTSSATTSRSTTAPRIGYVPCASTSGSTEVSPRERRSRSVVTPNLGCVRWIVASRERARRRRIG